MRRYALFLSLSLLCGGIISGQSSTTDLEGTWSGVLKTLAGELRLVVHFTIHNADSVSATLDSPEQSAFGIPCGRVTLTDDSLHLDVPAVQGSYQGVLSGDSLISGNWRQMGGKYDLTLTRGEKPVVYNRPQTPEPPYPYREEEVTFQNQEENFTLAGTLTLPQGEGPFPAVVLITGSGQQDRDETIFMHKPFLVIADHLTRNGIAVLRYDDRGVGGSKGNVSNATSLSFAGDVEAAVSWLLQRPEIDSKKIGLAGHSEGGLIASIVASHNSTIAYIISLAGTGVKGHSLLLRQAEDIMRAAGASPEEIRETVTNNRKLFSMLTAEPDQRKFVSEAMAWYGRELNAEALLAEERKEKMAAFTQSLVALNNPWMRYFVKTDPAEYWSQVKCPVLALNGTKDLQVNHDMNLPAIRAALRSGGNRKVKTVALPGLNHLFQTAETGLPDEYINIEETFSPAVLVEMTKWIRKSMKMK